MATTITISQTGLALGSALAGAIGLGVAAAFYGGEPAYGYSSHNHGGGYHRRRGPLYNPPAGSHSRKKHQRAHKGHHEEVLSSSQIKPIHRRPATTSGRKVGPIGGSRINFGISNNSGRNLGPTNNSGRSLGPSNNSGRSLGPSNSGRSFGPFNNSGRSLGPSNDSGKSLNVGNNGGNLGHRPRPPRRGGRQKTSNRGRRVRKNGRRNGHRFDVARVNSKNTAPQYDYLDYDDDPEGLENLLASIRLQDPKGCALQYFCELNATPLEELNQEELNILSLVGEPQIPPGEGLPPYVATQEFAKAGLTGRRSGRCSRAYPKCPLNRRSVRKVISEFKTHP